MNNLGSGRDAPRVTSGLGGPSLTGFAFEA